MVYITTAIPAIASPTGQNIHCVPSRTHHMSEKTCEYSTHVLHVHNNTQQVYTGASDARIFVSLALT